MNSISQNLIHISNTPPTIPVRQFTRRQAGAAAMLLAGLDVSTLGISIKQYENGTIELLALATRNQVVLISFQSDNRTGLLPVDGPFETLLRGGYGTIAGFSMARMAVHVYRDLQYRVCGVDLSTLCSGSTRQTWRPSKLVVDKIFQNVNQAALDSLWDENDMQGIKNVCLRAWISASVAGCCTADVGAALKVDTQFLSRVELVCLSELLRVSDLLHKAKPQEKQSEVSHFDWSRKGDLRLYNSRYRTRVRRSDQTAVVMTSTDGREFKGRAVGVSGKTSNIQFRGSAKFSGTLQSVRVVGREEPTNPERACDEFVLLLLRGERKLEASRFNRLLWFPTTTERNQPRTRDPPPPRPIQPLNASQYDVVAGMISVVQPLVIVQGPPGTGKTKTISAAVEIWDSYDNPVWIVAHSNVAVKNIAETLFKRNIDFKILVSPDFYVEWHEHLYTEIEKHLLRSDELPDDIRALEREIGSSRVILSTLSMLSNPALDQKGMFNLIPVQRLVIDEASQINLFEFMHVFDKFNNLEKICFFGDPKQLPPYGQEAAPSLQSIFDIQHLQNQAYFLDTQYRMPVPLGTFISQEVYGARLRSHHSIVHMSCIAFVDVSKGSEVNSGFSWMNLEEIQIIVHLVRHYYKHRKFCIITPYDAQRAAIERQLKDEFLPWERVFNVDSFQGNEEDYVLVSVVRTKKSGFLRSQNRMNVMLSRCRAGMVIVTNRAFLRTDGQHTMLGSLSKYWAKLYGESKTWVDWKLVAEQKVDMPGAPGLRHGANTTLISVPFLKPSSRAEMEPAALPLYQAQGWRDEHFPPLPGNSAPSCPVQDGWSALTSGRLQHNVGGDIKGTAGQGVQGIRSNRTSASPSQSIRAAAAPVSPEIPLVPSGPLPSHGGQPSLSKFSQVPRPQIQGRWNQGFQPITNVRVPGQTSSPSLNTSVQHSRVSRTSMFAPPSNTISSIHPNQNHKPDLDNISHFPSLGEFSSLTPVQGHRRSGTGANTVKGDATSATTVAQMPVGRNMVSPDQDDNFLPSTRRKGLKSNKRIIFRASGIHNS